MKTIRQPHPQETRLQQRLLSHHLPLAIGTVACIAALFATRPYRDWISRMSFATAYPSLLLLLVTLCIGPLNLLGN